MEFTQVRAEDFGGPLAGARAFAPSLQLKASEAPHQGLLAGVPGLPCAGISDERHSAGTRRNTANAPSSPGADAMEAWHRETAILNVSLGGNST